MSQRKSPRTKVLGKTSAVSCRFRRFTYFLIIPVIFLDHDDIPITIAPSLARYAVPLTYSTYLPLLFLPPSSRCLASTPNAQPRPMPRTEHPPASLYAVRRSLPLHYPGRPCLQNANESFLELSERLHQSGTGYRRGSSRKPNAQRLGGGKAWSVAQHQERRGRLAR